MTIKSFLKEVKRQLTSLKPGIKVGNYIFVGINKKDGYGSPGGKWEPKDFPAFELKKNEKTFLLRIVPEYNKIVIEAVHLSNMLINYTLKTENFIETNEKIKLLENYAMTVKHRRSLSDVKNAMIASGMPGNIIFETAVNKFNLGNIVDSLFDWADYREKAKAIIRVSNEGGKAFYQNTDRIIPNTNKHNTAPNLNQILFGPPGTGKTYSTINKAVAIANSEFDLTQSRQEIKKEFDRLMREGQIIFTTFHQSMNYEDFIEGIKPIEPDKEGDPVIYKIVFGIFRNLCIEASFAIAQLRESKTTEEVLDFSILYDNLAEGIEEKLLNGQRVELETKTGGSVMVEAISQQGNFIIKHHEGTRTYTVSKARLTKLQSVIKNLDEVSNINDQFREIIGGSNSSAYWSVLNAIRKEKPTKIFNKEIRNYTFEEKKDVVLSLSKGDYKYKKGKPYVLIIDEINRGNVSQIFGELITLIEEDKRLGNEEAIEVILPYSKDRYGVPSNLFIIGTMNTADRSVEALDAALRRRFSFEEISTKPELISSQMLLQNLWDKNRELDWESDEWKKIETGFLKLTGGKILNRNIYEEKEERFIIPDPDLDLSGAIEFSGISLEELLIVINKRIEKLLDKDHQIGHSYFMSVSNFEELKATFQNKIIPLLQEYFFGDYGKIGLVLGKEFFKAPEKTNKNIFATFDDYDASEFSEKIIYKIKDISKMSEEDFNSAIKALLKK